MQQGDAARTLRQAVTLAPVKVLNPALLGEGAVLGPSPWVLILLAAGKGTRFGQAPKCAQRVDGVPLARHSINAFRSCLGDAPAICLVGYRHEEVQAALGPDNLYVRSENPAGGTAFAAYEAFSVPGLEDFDPLLIVTMGDRIVPASIFKRLCEVHAEGGQEAALTFLTAVYEPPANRGKGRVIRDARGRVLGIVEQRDIDAIAESKLRQPLEELTEGNCPLYAIRARTLRRHLEGLANNNAQGQYYLTDIIESIRREGGLIRTVSTSVGEPEYDLLCSDVTRPMDLALLEGVLRSSKLLVDPLPRCVEEAAAAIRADRPTVQTAAVRGQLQELLESTGHSQFKPDRPVALGIAGGRLRIAFMHPDMGRFLGPAWQMPIGAGDPGGREQILAMVQDADDSRLHLLPTRSDFQEKISSVDANSDSMYPGDDVTDWYRYESFGTRMSERLLLSLGYFSDEELQRRRERGLPEPPSSLWISTSMRRPFSLVGNALASLRTLRTGNLGQKVQAALGKGRFRGLTIVLAGNIPRGGFSSSSSVTVATKNAINALFDLGLSPELLVHLSCQAEYGTGVRAGSLDQATEQKGRAGEGTLLSSNPRDNYRILGAFPVPAQRFQVIFPYSVDRDHEAWRWSAGAYAANLETEGQTAGEMRKLTGKVAEMAALLLRLPLDQDFFPLLEGDLLSQGKLSPPQLRWVADQLLQLPLLISREELRLRLRELRDWYVEQAAELERVDRAVAGEKFETTMASLLAGWREPRLARPGAAGRRCWEAGVPLRAMLAYLFGEVAKNIRLIRQPEEWIHWVSRSQWGDRCVSLEPERLPDAQAMGGDMDWEKGVAGPALLERWLERFGAQPFDFNRGLQDGDLARADLPDLHLMEGSNFFRGLALIDMAEAMLKRAFGSERVAVRVNAAGQGDYFQVHVDTHYVEVAQVKEFLRRAFYRRFGLTPEQDFVEVHPGGPAVGVRLDRFDQLPQLVQALGSVVASRGMTRAPVAGSPR